MAIAQRALSVLLLAGLAAGCATAPPSSKTAGTTGGRYKVGAPYQIGDNWYYPHEQPDYDETGVASWYGPTFYGKPTANGELFTGDDLTAAHRTLPMPVNVRVTNLDNGKSIVLRVNDRGPYAKGRIIDVSKHAAELLGFYAKGTARVRVTYLGRADVPNREPSENPVLLAKALRAAPTAKVQTASLSSTTRMAAPAPVQVASLDAVPSPPADETSVADVPPPDSEEPSDEVTTVLVPAKTHLYVQAGAFSTRENADRLKTRLADASGLFVSATKREGRPLYRVRSGPYDDLEAANAALAQISGLGNNDAQIVVDQ